MTSSSSAWKQHATWQDRGGDGKDGVKWHKDWNKIWGTSKCWQLIWLKKKKKRKRCWSVWAGQSETVRVGIRQGMKWHKCRLERRGITSHVNKAGWGVRSHVAHPSEHAPAWAVLPRAGGEEDLSSMGEMSLIHQWLTDVPSFPFHRCSDWHASASFRSVVHLLKIYREHLHSSLCSPRLLIMSTAIYLQLMLTT